MQHADLSLWHRLFPVRFRVRGPVGNAGSRDCRRLGGVLARCKCGRVVGAGGRFLRLRAIRVLRCVGLELMANVAA